MPDFNVKVENVVAVATLDVSIPLDKMLSKTERSEYEPEQFPGLVYRPEGLNVAALIFSSGKIVCTGARSPEAAKDAMMKVVRKIQEIGITVPKVFDIQIENMVASSQLSSTLSLEELAMSLDNAEYEPEQFPGLVYRITDPRISFLLFSTGRIIITGAQSEKDIHRGLLKLRDNLKKAGVRAEPAKV